MSRKTLNGFVVATVVAVVIEGLLAWHLGRWWQDLKHTELAYAYQAAAAFLVGWPTIVFALAATYAAIRSAQASEKQAEAALIQAIAADAQAEAARSAIRPVLIVEPDFSTLGIEKIWVQNKGVGVATQITWAVCSAPDSTGLNVFIRPKVAGYAVLRRGGFSGALQNGDTNNQSFDPVSIGNKLVLVNCLDLSGNIHQTQLLLFHQGGEHKGILGFSTLTIAERRILASSLPTIPTPEDVGLTAW